MPSPQKRPSKKSRKPVYIPVAVAVIVVGVIVGAFILFNPPVPPNNHAAPPTAIIVDHLAFRDETRNITFQIQATDVLKSAGFDVIYYQGDAITIPFYKNLFATATPTLLVFRVHSAILSDPGYDHSLSLFTSEILDEGKYNTSSAPYYQDIVNDRIVAASLPYPYNDTAYFAIAANFVKHYGTFHDTTVILAGCGGLQYDTMADAFQQQGAHVCIGWNGLVSAPHADAATIHLLQQVTQNTTVAAAVATTNEIVGPEERYFLEQGYNSTLRYYPPDAANQFLLYTRIRPLFLVPTLSVHPVPLPGVATTHEDLRG